MPASVRGFMDNNEEKVQDCSESSRRHHLEQSASDLWHAAIPLVQENGVSDRSGSQTKFSLLDEQEFQRYGERHLSIVAPSYWGGEGIVENSPLSLENNNVLLLPSPASAPLYSEVPLESFVGFSTSHHCQSLQQQFRGVSFTSVSEDSLPQSKPNCGTGGDHSRGSQLLLTIPCQDYISGHFQSASLISPSTATATTARNNTDLHYDFYSNISSPLHSASSTTSTTTLLGDEAQSHWRSSGHQHHKDASNTYCRGCHSFNERVSDNGKGKWHAAFSTDEQRSQYCCQEQENEKRKSRAFRRRTVLSPSLRYGLGSAKWASWRLIAEKMPRFQWSIHSLSVVVGTMFTFSSNSTGEMGFREGLRLMYSRRRRRFLQRYLWAGAMMLAVGLGACVIVLCVKRGLGLCYRWPKDPRASTSQPSQYTATTRGENESLVFQAHSVSESASFMEDSLDYYPDEGEDDFTEAASFVTWLTQASIKHATSTHNSDQDSGLPLQQQSQQYQHSFQASRDSGEGQPSAFVNEKFITYLPFAGLSNQFYGMLRAMYIARALGRTLLLPPITSSSHDKTRKNQPWSDFFDLNKFQRRTGLRVIEYHSLRDQGNFRGPTGIRESGSSVGASWISPLQYGGDGTHSPEPRRSGILGQSSFVIQDQKDGNFVSQEPNTPSLTEKSFMMATYQHSPGTGTGSVDMSMPCHVTCGFGSKRGLDYTAKAFLRQWGFEYKKLMLPTKPKPSKSLQSDETTNKESDKEKVNSVPIDQTREFNRILESLMDESLEKEPLICISNTYKIQVPTTSTAQDPGVSSGPSFTIDSPEWHEFGQHLFFQPRLVQFVNTFLEQTLGQSPEHRLVFEKETFGSVHMQRSSSQTQQSTLGPQTNHTFFMLHVRRGDFESYCKKDFPDDKLFSQCLPPVEAYFKVVEDLQLWAQHQVQAQGQPLGFPVPEDMTSEDAKTQLILDRDSQVKKAGSRRKIPVIVGTNEHRAEELARLRRPKATSDEGDDDEWIVLDHDKLKTVEHFGVFGPMMIEQVLMAEAEVLVGVKMSTFSRVGAYRQRDWYGRRIVYM